MTYTILIYETQDDFGARTDPKRKDGYWGAYRAYTVALREAGVMVGGHGLQPAAVATVVSQRAVTGHTDWEAIALLYEGLVRVAPTIGARVAHAAALAEARGAAAGLGALDAMPKDVVMAYQPYWALRGHLLRELGRTDEARDAYARAIGLSEDGAVREFLSGQTPP